MMHESIFFSLSTLTPDWISVEVSVIFFLIFLMRRGFSLFSQRCTVFLSDQKRLSFFPE